MKKTFYITAALAVFAQAAHAQEESTTAPPKSPSKAAESSAETAEKHEPVPAREVHFTPEQLQTYYRVYTMPQVHYLRKALDTYLNGKASQVEARALDKWSKDYYRSKFIVMSVDPGLLGGTFLTIMFQDNPDKVFVAWVYNKAKDQADLKYMELRSMELGKFNGQELKNIRIRYRPFLADKVHAM
jgi:hypothetical protein